MLAKPDDFCAQHVAMRLRGVTNQALLADDGTQSTHAQCGAKGLHNPPPGSHRLHGAQRGQDGRIEQRAGGSVGVHVANRWRAQAALASGAAIWR
ncbi:hypothetical protein D3C71_1294650 [compost metagenome]